MYIYKHCTWTTRALHVKLCSEFTVLLHAHHGIPEVGQVRFITGAWSLNQEELKKNLVYFKVPSASVEPIHEKLAMKIFDECTNILQGMYCIRFTVMRAEKHSHLACCSWLSSKNDDFALILDDTYMNFVVYPSKTLEVTVKIAVSGSSHCTWNSIFLVPLLYKSPFLKDWKDFLNNRTASLKYMSE